MPSSSSTVIWVHTPVLPLIAQEPFSHVSLPNSPGCGIVLNCQSFARAGIERAHKPLGVVVRGDGHAFLEGRPDEDDVA